MRSRGTRDGPSKPPEFQGLPAPACEAEAAWGGEAGELLVQGLGEISVTVSAGGVTYPVDVREWGWVLVSSRLQ